MMEATGPSLKDMHTTILDSAYLAMATNSDLTEEQMAAIEICKPDREEINFNVARCANVVRQQLVAGTREQREAERQKLAAINTELPAQIEELQREIQRKQKQIRQIESERDAQQLLVDRMDAAVMALRQAAPKFIEQRQIVMLQRTRPLRARRNEIRQRLGMLERLHRAKPGPTDLQSIALNRIAEDAGVPGRLVVDRGHDLDNGAYQWEYEFDEIALAETKRATEKELHALRLENDEINQAIEAADREAAELSDYYLK